MQGHPLSAQVPETLRVVSEWVIGIIKVLNEPLFSRRDISRYCPFLALLYVQKHFLGDVFMYSSS